MQASELRHPVDIEKRVAAGDGYAWVLYKHVMAQIAPLSGREFLSADQNVNPISARIKTWFVAGVDPTMRVRHGETIYNIHAVLEDYDSGNRWMTLPVSRGTNVG